MAQHRNFNSTQPVGHFQSEEKAYPNRQGMDDGDLIPTNRNFHDMNTMSPQRQRGVEYITEGENSTADMTRTAQYRSAQKMRIGKKTSADPGAHGMSATIHTTTDGELPNVKGAMRSKRTIH